MVNPLRTPTLRTAARALGPALVLVAALGPGAPVPTAAQVLNPVSGNPTDPWPRGGIRLDLAVARHGESDRMASPLPYYGTAPGIGLAYRWIRDASRLEVAASFTSLHLAAGPLGGGRADALSGVLQAQWLRRAAERLYWRGFLGARLDILASFRRHYYPPAGHTELYGDVFIPLQVVAAHELRLTPRMVAWQALSTPVAALVLRSPYTGLKNLPDLELAPPGRLLGFDHVLGVDGSLGAHWGWVAEWRLSVLHYPEPRAITLATHWWTFGVEVRP